MQSISFASGGDPVSMNLLKFYFLIRVKRNFYVKHVNHYLSFPNILLQFVNSHMQQAAKNLGSGKIFPVTDFVNTQISGLTNDTPLCYQPWSYHLRSFLQITSNSLKKVYYMSVDGPPSEFFSKQSARQILLISWIWHIRGSLFAILASSQGN